MYLPLAGGGAQRRCGWPTPGPDRLTTMAAVTVVITGYNQGPLIRETVESALAQTVRPERFIIVDDGSDDYASVEMLNAILDDCRHGTMDTNGVAIDLIGRANAGPSAAPRGSAAAATTSRCAAASRTGTSSCRCWSAD